MTVVELALIAALALPNSPYPKRLTLIPELAVTLKPAASSPFYLKLISSARCLPGEWNRWNPITAKYTGEAGLDFGWARAGVGHQSEHGIDEIWPATESMDYGVLRFRF